MSEQLKPGVERDRPKTWLLLVLLIVGSVLLGIVVVFVIQFFDIMVRNEQDVKVLRKPAAALLALIDEENAKLTSYQWVKKVDGTVRIPVDRALELTLAEWNDKDKHPEGLVEYVDVPPAAPASQPASAPASAPAAPASAPAASGGP